MQTRFITTILILIGAAVAPAMQSQESFDVIIRGGSVYDGSGSAPRRADVGLRGDQISAVGDLSGAKAGTIVDATGLAVAPGFINMLSWSTESLLADGRSQGEIRQGVTTQIMGEGDSMGPLTDEMKRRASSRRATSSSTSRGRRSREYLNYLEKRGVSQNVASFIGATTIREHVVGLEDRKATPDELERMRALVRAGDGSGRARHRVVADLCAGVLRQDRRADRAVQGGGAVSAAGTSRTCGAKGTGCSKRSTS